MKTYPNPFAEFRRWHREKYPPTPEPKPKEEKS